METINIDEMFRKMNKVNANQQIDLYDKQNEELKN